MALLPGGILPGAGVGPGGGDLGPLETVTVSNRTTDQCVISFNGASVVVNGMQVKQLQKMLAKVASAASGMETKEMAAQIEIGPLT